MTSIDFIHSVISTRIDNEYDSTNVIDDFGALTYLDDNRKVSGFVW